MKDISYKTITIKDVEVNSSGVKETDCVTINTDYDITWIELIDRVFESLSAQGYVMPTRERLINQWIKDGKVKIRIQE